MSVGTVLTPILTALGGMGGATALGALFNRRSNAARAKADESSADHHEAEAELADVRVVREIAAELRTALEESKQQAERCRQENAQMSQDMLDLRREVAHLRAELETQKATSEHDQRELERRLQGQYEARAQQQKAEFERRILAITARLGVEEGT